MSSQSTPSVVVGTRRRRLLLVALVAPLLALAGCSGASSSGTAAPGSASGATAASSASGSATAQAGEGTFPVTIKAGNGPVTLTGRPKAIVSLAPSLTEMIYAAGAGGQVKAVDDQSNYPTEAPRTKLSGFQPNAEAIAGYEPDLVVLSGDSNGLVAALTKLEIPVLLLPAPSTLEEGYTQQLDIGLATGHGEAAREVVDTTKRRVAAAIASVPKPIRAPKIYHELDQTYYSVTSKTFIGSLYTQFGLQNIADTAPKAAGGYPQLSAEFVVSAGPDVIVLADGKCCQQSAATVAKRPAFASVPAVTQNKVVVVDDDIASRWGPRVADFAELLAKALGGK
jgi:iron complex transport system substrate-binding protein